MDLFVIRLVFVLTVGVACYVLRPFGLEPRFAAAVGVAIGAAVILFELRLHQVSTGSAVLAPLADLAAQTSDRFRARWPELP